MTLMEYVGIGALLVGFIISLITLFQSVKKSLTKESIQKINELSKELDEVKKIVQRHDEKFKDIEKTNKELSDKVSGLCAKLELMYDSLQRIELHLLRESKR